MIMNFHVSVDKIMIKNRAFKNTKKMFKNKYIYISINFCLFCLCFHKCNACPIFPYHFVKIVSLEEREKYDTEIYI